MMYDFFADDIFALLLNDARFSRLRMAILVERAGLTVIIFVRCIELLATNKSIYIYMFPDRSARRPVH